MKTEGLRRFPLKDINLSSKKTSEHGGQVTLTKPLVTSVLTLGMEQSVKATPLCSIPLSQCTQSGKNC